MSTDLNVLGMLGILPVVWDVVQQSWVFAVVKWFLIIYTVVLFLDVVLLVLLRGVTENLKVQLYGATRPMVSKNKAADRFGTIERRLRSDNPSQYKVAVLEADEFVDELLRESGYAGENLGERLEGMHPGQLMHLEELKAAHAVRNQIIREPEFQLDRSKAEELLGQYRSLLVELELLDS